MRAAALALGLAAALLAAPAARAAEDMPPEAKDFAPLLQRQLLNEFSIACLQSNPELLGVVEASRDGWIKRNAAAIAAYDARYARLAKPRQDAVYDHFRKVSELWRDRLDADVVAGKGEQACRTLMAAYDKAPPLAMPPGA